MLLSAAATSTVGCLAPPQATNIIGGMARLSSSFSCQLRLPRTFGVLPDDKLPLRVFGSDTATSSSTRLRNAAAGRLRRRCGCCEPYAFVTYDDDNYRETYTCEYGKISHIILFTVATCTTTVRVVRVSINSIIRVPGIIPYCTC